MGCTSIAILAICSSIFVLDICAQGVENWRSLGVETCFESKGRKPGEFTIPEEGFLGGLRFTHVSGGVNCNSRHKECVSKFGCHTHYANLKGKIGVLVTDASGETIILPVEKRNRHNGHTYYYSGGNWSNSSKLTFYDDFRPVFVDGQSTLKLWYTEDFYNRGQTDNEGKSCVTVEVLYAE